MRIVYRKFFIAIGVLLIIFLSSSIPPTFTKAQEITIGVNEFHADPASGLSGDSNQMVGGCR